MKETDLFILCFLATLSSGKGAFAETNRLRRYLYQLVVFNVFKRFFERTAHPERAIDPRLPIPVEQLPKPLFEAPERILPSKAECEANPRARSAVLRAAARTAAPWRATDAAPASGAKSASSRQR